MMARLPPAGRLFGLSVDTAGTRSGWPAALNAASTVRFELIVTEHDPVPEQAPLQPAKTDPDAGVAVRLTPVPLA